MSRALRSLTSFPTPVSDSFGIQSLTSLPPLRIPARRITASSAGNRAIFEADGRLIPAFDAGDGLQAVVMGDERDQIDVAPLQSLTTPPRPADRASSTAGAGLSSIDGKINPEAIPVNLTRPAGGTRASLGNRQYVDTGAELLELRR